MKRLTVLTALAFALFTGTAFAAPDPAAVAADPAPPTAADLAAARSAAAGARVTLGKFFATKGRPAADTSVAAADSPSVSARVGEQPVPVYDLNPAFVTGQSTQIARFAFLATRATAPDGQTASVWTTRTRTGGWAVSNIASGDDEQAYATQPGTVFREPQVNAWYALRDGRVVPLNPEATTSIGPAGLPVADFQRLVQGRYADKLPGSAYDRDGAAGGYGLSSGAPTVAARSSDGAVLWIIAIAGFTATVVFPLFRRRTCRI
ncbi:hypothetical protein ACFY05_03965 [Microtetraspora fusca]|uniref:Secreted protein n=1 Tax=Microtetraspora fusca TaxID=1997 RepID=A0ABW6V076_MICFU